MGKRPEILPKLTALKRQAAEQRYQSALQALDALDRDIAALAGKRAALDAPGEVIDAAEMMARSQHGKFLTREIEKLQSRRPVLSDAVEQAREALKRAHYSEQRIRELARR